MMIKRLIFMLAAVALLAACGQKGPLQLPEVEPEPVEVTQ